MKQSTMTGRIRELREKFGYTQAEIGHKLNIQRATYSNYENETRALPLEVIIDLAELYHVSVDYIVRGVEPENTYDLNSSQKKLLKDYAQLAEGDQKEVSDFIDFKKMYPRPD